MKKKKSLQKFTELENLKTVKEVEKFVQDNPDLYLKLWKSLSNKLSESYEKELGEEYNIANMLVATTDIPTVIADVRNTTYETNHDIITTCIHNYLLENRRFPTMGTIIKETKLSRQTVYNHLNSGLKAKYKTLVQGKNEIMVIKALEKLYLIGVQDNNATALKHFINLSGGGVNNTTNVNNYIQINNLKISNEEFNQLPRETLMELEQIISKSLNP